MGISEPHDPRDNETAPTEPRPRYVYPVAYTNVLTDTEAERLVRHNEGRKKKQPFWRGLDRRADKQT